MKPQQRDTFRRLAIFNTEGEAIDTLLLHVDAIFSGYQRNAITVEVRGQYPLVFNLSFEHIVCDYKGIINQKYPQLLANVINGNPDTLEDVDFKFLARILNSGLPRGEYHFRVACIRSLSSSYMRKASHGIF